MCMYILFCYNLCQFLLSSILCFHPLILYVICVSTPQIIRSFRLQMFPCPWVFSSDCMFFLCTYSPIPSSYCLYFNNENVRNLIYFHEKPTIANEWQDKTQHNLWDWLILNFKSFTHGENWLDPKLQWFVDLDLLF